MIFRALAVILLLLATPLSAQSLCVFSIEGAQGPLWQRMQDYAVQARSWGVCLTLRPFTDERVAAEDLKAGHCDALLMTGIRARQFNPFTGSIDAIGGLPDYDALQVLIEVLARPQLATKMRHGAYEVAGIMPLGAAYLFLHDRRINSVEKIAGHSMAVLDNDQAQTLMAERIGARPVSSDVSNFASKFNNGVVDIIAAPATAYMPMELYRGVGAHGVVLKMAAAELTFQLVVRQARFSADFAARSRRYFADHFNDAMKLIHASEDEILFFFPPPDADRERYRLMMDDARTWLIEQGVYDKDLMQWAKKVRCKLAPSHAECSNGRPW